MAVLAVVVFGVSQLKGFQFDIYSVRKDFRLLFVDFQLLANSDGGFSAGEMHVFISLGAGRRCWFL
jgi:hypothetical protein